MQPTLSSGLARPTRRRWPTLSATNITDNVSPGPGIQFNEKGQNDKLKNSAIQNRGGKLVTVAPKSRPMPRPNCR